MDKNKLERKLKTIHELKANHYLGTQDAWIYLQRLEGLYNGPRQIANAINERLAKEGPINFPAKPEQIVGLGMAAEELFSGSHKLFQQIFGNNRYIGPPFSRFRDNLLGSIVGVSERQGADYSPPNHQILIENIFPHYSNAQEDIKHYEQWKLGEEFAADIMPSLVLDFPRSNQFSQDQLFELFFLKPLFEEKVRKFEWDYLFSKECLRNFESEEKKSIYSESISIEDRTRRMIRDQVDHRLENRREIVTDCLDRSGSYEEAIGQERIDMEYWKSWEDELTRDGKARDTYDVKLTQRNIEVAKSIIAFLAADKNFAKKYLGE